MPVRAAAAPAPGPCRAATDAPRTRAEAAALAALLPACQRSGALAEDVAFLSGCALRPGLVSGGAGRGGRTGRPRGQAAARRARAAAPGRGGLPGARARGGGGGPAPAGRARLHAAPGAAGGRPVHSQDRAQAARAARRSGHRRIQLRGAHPARPACRLAGCQALWGPQGRRRACVRRRTRAPWHSGTRRQWTRSRPGWTRTACARWRPVSAGPPRRRRAAARADI